MLVAALAFLALSAPAPPVETLETLDFEAYVIHHGKHYALEELATRKGIFEANKKKVVSHNEVYRAGNATWWMALNHLADRTPEELRTLRSTKVASASPFPVRRFDSKAPNPVSVDWRKKGAVTAVKNQGMCGSCWAFSATETMESMHQITNGPLLTLAPQTFVDCVQNPDHCGGTGGCEGATMELAFNLTISKGIATEADMPYKATDEACPMYKPAVKATSYVKNPVNDAAAFETAVATVGPMSVTVAAGSWSLYGGGIFDSCSSNGDATLDHGVQTVGYTADAWIVRNSWGPSWGEQGYIRLSRTSDDKTFVDKAPADGTACLPLPKTQTIGGECGVLFDTSYPIGVTAA